MATVAWTPTTSGTNLDKVWWIVQLQLQQAFNFSYPEWNVLSNKISRMRINLSARQIILPLDLAAAGTARLVEAVVAHVGANGGRQLLAHLLVTPQGIAQR